MAVPLLGPQGRIDLDARQWVAASQRRPLAAPGLDQAWLWHRGSLFFRDVIPPAKSKGPSWWEGDHGWGSKGFLVRPPKVLYISSYDQSDDSIARADACFNGMPPGVSQFFGGGEEFPFLTGLPVTGQTEVNQDGSFKNPVDTPAVLGTDLFRGGILFIAVVTKWRVSFQPTFDSVLGINDYTFAAIDEPAAGGYLSFPDSTGPNPHEGFTVFTKDAFRDRSLMNACADRCIGFHMRFYQSNAEAPGNGVGATDSRIVPDGAITDLLGGDPRLSRSSFTDGDLDGVFKSISDDAKAFFS